ncbi:hypothetical protein UFOVP45_122 [uncultured Caudovirales phage]|uniref:Uncharacterized protein n=1 Tax=uncultured Caudovirales phage TaxID=2100421 RepID=A0A6J5KQ78_9CAUD|nr:hypothetical protein UFOVP45_122 [uncultured Caudovirales phage]
MQRNELLAGTTYAIGTADRFDKAVVIDTRPLFFKGYRDSIQRAPQPSARTANWVLVEVTGYGGHISQKLVQLRQIVGIFDDLQKAKQAKAEAYRDAWKRQAEVRDLNKETYLASRYDLNRAFGGYLSVAVSDSQFQVRFTPEQFAQFIEYTTTKEA